MRDVVQHIVHAGGRLLVSTTLLTDAGISPNTLKKARNTTSNHWRFIKLKGHAAHFAEWDALRLEIKRQVRMYLGGRSGKGGAAELEPVEVLKSTKILELVEQCNSEAYNFYRWHEVTPEVYLKSHLQEKYTQAACYLQVFGQLQEGTAAITPSLRKLLSANQYQAFRALLKLNKVALPKSYCRLLEKYARFKAAGADHRPRYESLIQGYVGNENALKVKQGPAQDMLVTMIAHPMGLDYPQIALAYSRWAETHNYKRITDRTVGNYARRFKPEISHSRNGKKAHLDEFTKIIHRRPTSRPLIMCEADDNSLDLTFRELSFGEAGKPASICAYIVSDRFADYPLGFAIGATPTVDLIKQAFANAIYHIYQSTGQWLVPHQLQTDRFGIKQVSEWANKWCKFTPAPARRARGKRIEGQVNGRHLHNILRNYPGYNGNNITAKKRISPDWIQANFKNAPALQEAWAVANEVIEQLRDTEWKKTGKTRRQLWQEAVKELPQEARRTLTDQQRLDWFGFDKPETKRLTNAGLEIALMGKELTFDVPGDQYIKHVGKSFSFKYFPYTPYQVLATADAGQTQLVLQEYNRVAGNLYDRLPGEETEINRLISESRQADQAMINSLESRMQRLGGAHVVEAALKARMLPKGQQMPLEQGYKHQLAQPDTQPAPETAAPVKVKKVLAPERETLESIRQRAFNDL